MKRLTLLRHAKSSWRDGSLPDRERPLSSRGQRDAPAMGLRLKDRGERPSLILSSNAVRARSTAHIVAAALGCPEDMVRSDRRLYLASPEAILDVLAAQDDRLAHILIVGHNPGLTELANRLLPDLVLAKLPTAGVVAIATDASAWSELVRSARRLLYLDFPKRTG